MFVLTLSSGRESFLVFDKDDEGIVRQVNCHRSLLCRNVLRSISLDALSSKRRISCREILVALEILDLCRRNA